MSDAPHCQDRLTTYQYTVVKHWAALQQRTRRPIAVVDVAWHEDPGGVESRLSDYFLIFTADVSDRTPRLLKILWVVDPGRWEVRDVTGRTPLRPVTWHQTLMAALESVASITAG